jgi:hypothetical protein
VATQARPPGGARDGAGFDWTRVADGAVWVAVGVIAILGIEWFIGFLAREKMTRAADRILAGTGKAGKPETTT